MAALVFLHSLTPLVAQIVKTVSAVRGTRVQTPGEGNGYPLQYSCLENSMDRGGWRATVHAVAKSWTYMTE